MPESMQIGAVKVRQENGVLALARAWSADGWNVEVVEENAEEVEVEFDSHDERWRFGAKTDDGQLRVALAHKVTDPLRS